MDEWERCEVWNDRFTPNLLQCPVLSLAVRRVQRVLSITSSGRAMYMMIMTLDRRAITTRRLAASGISILYRVTGMNDGGGDGAQIILTIAVYEAQLWKYD
jgi:hypothetical protein